MSTTEPAEGQFQEHEAFDPVDLATEVDQVEFAEETAEAGHAEEVEALAEGAALPDAAPSETGLLERALKAAGSDAARYIPVRFVPALTSLLTTPLFTRAIGTADYGAFYLISSIMGVMAAIAVGWLQSASIRYYWPFRKAGKLDGYTSTIVWTGFTSLVATCVVTGIAVYVARGAIDPLIVRLVPIGLVYFVANFYTTAMMQVLRAANRASAFAKLQVSTTLLVTIGSVVLVWYGHLGAFGILAGAAIGNLIVAPFILRNIAKEGSLSPAHFDRPLLAELLSYGLPLVPGALAGMALVVLDRFIVGFFRGASEVGIYSVSYSLGDKIMGLVTIPLILTMMPSLIEAYEKHGQNLAEKVQSQFTRYFAILTVPLLVGMGTAAPVFMFVFTGPKYRGAYPVLGLVAAASMLGSFAQLAGAGLGIHKKTKLIMADTIAAATFNAILNVIFVPKYGYMAAAWATLAAYGMLLFLTWWQSRRFMRWLIPWAQLGRIALASVGMGVVVAAMGGFFAPNVLLLTAQALIGIVVYAALLTLLGGIRPSEVAFVRGVVTRGAGRLRRR